MEVIYFSNYIFSQDGLFLIALNCSIVRRISYSSDSLESYQGLRQRKDKQNGEREREKKEHTQKKQTKKLLHTTTLLLYNKSNVHIHSTTRLSTRLKTTVSQYSRVPGKKTRGMGSILYLM